MSGKIYENYKLSLRKPYSVTIRSIHARGIIGRKRGLAGIGTKLVGVKLLNTLQQVSKLTSTN